MSELILAVALGAVAWGLLRLYRSRRERGGTRSFGGAAVTRGGSAVEPPVSPADALKDLPRRLYIEFRDDEGKIAKREIDAEFLRDQGGQLTVSGYCHRIKARCEIPVGSITALVDRHNNAAFKGAAAQAALTAAAVARGAAAVPESLAEAKARAEAAFRDWAGRDDWLLMSCLTDGHAKTSEIIEISVINARGETLIDKRLRCEETASDTPYEGTSDCGRSPQVAVVDATTWPAIHDQVCQTLAAAPFVLAYNALFTLRLLEQTAAQHDLPLPELEFDCVMLAYAALRAELGENGQAKWHELEEAAAHEGIAAAPPQGALGNCQATWRLIRKIGGL